VMQIQTVPPLADIPISLSGPAAADGSIDPASMQSTMSGESGLARFTLPGTGDYRLEVTVPGDSDSGKRLEFSRWLDEVFEPTREINISIRELTAGPVFQVGFEVSSLVTLSPVDLNGRAIGWERVDSVTLLSSIGQRQTIEKGEPEWLKGRRVTRRQNGLEVTAIQYSIESAIVDGSNVVNRAQQRFYPSESHEWPVQLLLYSAHFSARDAIFGYPVGSGIELVYPDGHIEEYEFGPSAELSIESLPRGEYKVSVKGGGYAPPRPVALSRDQVVELQVISLVDIGVMLLVVAVPALGLFLVGRPHLVAAIRRRATTLPTRIGQPPEGRPPVNTDSR